MRFRFNDAPHMLTDVITASKRDGFYGQVIESIAKEKSGRWHKKLFEELDDWRYNELPEILEQRWKSEEEVWLTKSELQCLMDYKLQKGKFRATLPKLIAQNSDEEVREATSKGLTEWLQKIGGIKSNNAYIEAAKVAIKDLSVLRGVGPATATLILSLLARINPRAPPFFSDEAFMYYVLEPQRPDTKIKYLAPEYLKEYLPILLGLESETATLDELERGGWALKYYNENKYTCGEIDVSDFNESSFRQWEGTTIKDEPDDATSTKGSKPSNRKRKVDQTESTTKKRKS